MLPVRICRDCVYHDPADHTCLHPKSINVDLVTGKETKVDAFCMRIYPCGPEGKFWEAFPDVLRESDFEWVDEVTK